MDIGEPTRVIIIEPVEDPIRQPEPAEPEPVEQPVEAPA